MKGKPKFFSLKPKEKKQPRAPRPPLDPDTIAIIKFDIVWAFIAIAGVVLIWYYQEGISAFLNKIAGAFQ